MQAAQKQTLKAKLAKESQFCQRTNDVLIKCLNLRHIDYEKEEVLTDIQLPT